MLYNTRINVPKILIMKTDIEKKAEHILHLIKSAKDAGIEVIIKCPTKLN